MGPFNMRVRSFFITRISSFDCHFIYYISLFFKMLWISDYFYVKYFIFYISLHFLHFFWFLLFSLIMALCLHFFNIIYDYYYCFVHSPYEPCNLFFIYKMIFVILKVSFLWVCQFLLHAFFLSVCFKVYKLWFKFLKIL